MAVPSPKQRAVTMKRNGMDDGLVGAILGIDPDQVRSLVYDADPAVELPGAETPVLVTTVVLDDEQIKAMPSPAPVEIVSVEDVVAVPLLCILRFESPAAIGYGLLDNQSLGIGVESQYEMIGQLWEGVSSAPGKISSLLGNFTEKTAILAPQQHSAAAFSGGVVNDAPAGSLKLWLDEGAVLSGGDPDNTLSVQVAYMLLSD